MVPVSSLLLFVVAMYVAFTHGWSSDETLRESTDAFMRSMMSVFSKKRVTEKDINRTINFAQDSYGKLATLETILGYADVKVLKGSPTHAQFIENYPELESIEIMKDSLVSVAATILISYEYCDRDRISRADCARMLKYFYLTKTPLQRICSKLGRKICSQEEIYSKYRSPDGSCNNVGIRMTGESFTAYGRLLEPNYLEGIEEPRRSVTKQPLESARFISAILQRDPNPHEKLSLAVLYWGQFIEHDLSHTAMRRMYHTNKPIECCNTEGRMNSPRKVHPFCFPVKVTSVDDYYTDKDINCLSYVRSIPSVSSDCTLGPTQQLNQATHFLDGSQIYGVTKDRMDYLRSFKMGQMIANITGGEAMLPSAQDPETQCSSHFNGKVCFRSGDSRVNSNPQITAMYTLWIREHNRIASELGKINKEWDDETLFQETRRIVVAEMQHITYSEWIPLVLGKEITGHYVPNANPSISNAFATAALRAIQSARTGKISAIQEEKKIELRSQKPFNLGTYFKEMVITHFKGRTLNNLGEMNNITYGYDILSMDIQRGRDHGLPTYNEYRKYCGLNKLNGFEDLNILMTLKTIESLKKAYKNVEDIDIIVGGLSEKPGKGLFGPTLTCIMSEQFERSRESDRYFYTNSYQPMPFDSSQLMEIRKVTLARIICDNVDEIDKINPSVFELNPNGKVSAESCNSLPILDLQLWDNNRYSYS